MLWLLAKHTALQCANVHNYFQIVIASRIQIVHGMLQKNNVPQHQPQSPQLRLMPPIAKIFRKQIVQKPSHVRHVELIQHANGWIRNVPILQDVQHIRRLQMGNAKPFQVDASQMEHIV